VSLPWRACGRDRAVNAMIREFRVTQFRAQLCLARGAVDGALLSRLIAGHDLGFRAADASGDAFARGGVPFGEEALARLAAAGGVGWAEVSGGEGRELSLGGIAGRSVDQLIWRTDGMPSDLSMAEAVAALPGFTAGHLSDAEDVFCSRRPRPRPICRAACRTTTFPRSRAGSSRARTRRSTPRTTPGAVSRSVWFGAGAFALLDRDRLRALPVGEIEE